MSMQATRAAAYVSGCVRTATSLVPAMDARNRLVVRGHHEAPRDAEKRCRFYAGQYHRIRRLSSVLTRDIYRIYYGYMKTVLHIKADREVKEKAQKLAAELGLPLSTVVNATLKEFIRNRSVNFSAIPRMSRGLESLLSRVEGDLKRGRNLSPIFGDAEQAVRYLKSL